VPENLTHLSRANNIKAHQILKPSLPVIFHLGQCGQLLGTVYLPVINMANKTKNPKVAKATVEIPIEQPTDIKGAVEILTGIGQRAQALTTSYNNVADADMITVSESLGKKAKAVRTESLIDSFNVGKICNYDGIKKLIPSMVDEASVDKWEEKVKTFTDKTKTTLKPYDQWDTVTRCRNNRVKAFQDALKANKLSDEESLKYREHEESTMVSLETANTIAGYLNIEKRAISKEQHARKLVAIKAEMEKRELKTQSLKEMFDAKFGKVVTIEIEAPQ